MMRVESNPTLRPAQRRATTPRNAGRRGFTLIEAAIVTVIIGVGVVGMLELLAAGTQSNSDGTELTTAINLANNIREMSLGLAYYDPQSDPASTDPTKKPVWNSQEATVDLYDNIMDLDGATDTWNLQNPALGTNYDPPTGYQKFKPPLTVGRTPIPEYSNWEQWVKVETVSENNVSQILTHDPMSPTARVTVKIIRGGTEVYKMSWLAVAPKAN